MNSSELEFSPSAIPERNPLLNKKRALRPRLLWLLPFVVLVAGAGTWLLAQGRQSSLFPGPQPAFGALTASPPNFVFNTPTTVTFTIRIDTPTLNPTTVELQRVDAGGILIRTVGPLYDNGQGGDVKPGDRTFTAISTLNEPAIGRQYYRVTAAFRGNQQNAQSDITFVDVDPFPLPPDPGEAGKQTIEGIDSDGDGLRDDVQRYIALSQRTNEAVRNGLHQYAITNQLFIAAVNSDENTLVSIVQRRHAAQDCLNYLSGDVRRAYALQQELRSVFLNTVDRSRAYVIADAKLSGLSVPVSNPSEWSESCH